jgi:predicted O-linked N-acetylglucosamine transferase (SPINDLY family)
VVYAAPHWGNHVTSLLFQGIVTAHSEQVEVFLVAVCKTDDSSEFEALQSHPRLTLVDVSEQDDETAAKTIQALAPDVVIDLGVYSNNNRPGVLAHRPCAVQVSWQVAPYSSGAPWLDYIISDEQVRPEEGWCSEAEVIMPDCFFAFTHHPLVPLPAPSRASLGLPENKFVFACLSNANKISPDIFQCWMQLLQQAPDSVLWLLANDTANILNFKREAEWAGVDPRRLLFAFRTHHEAHLVRFGAADLFLDTWYCNGHTTVAECLWAGTPVLSLRGKTFASRVGASMLHGVNLPELIVDTKEAYSQRALELYQNRESLAALRHRLADSRQQTSFMNTERRVAQMEKVFFEMKRRAQLGMAPAAFSFAAL